jgi:hypothetical protein
MYLLTRKDITAEFVKDDAPRKQRAKPANRA